MHDGDQHRVGMRAARRFQPAQGAARRLNGDAAAANTISKLGVAGAQKSLVSGVMSVALQNSKLLKSAVLVDSFGRTFNANLTKATYNPGLDFTGYFLSSPFTSYAPFAFAARVYA